MSTATTRSGSKSRDTAQLDPRRWRALAVLGLIQFMLVLDLTVVNVALPRIQNDLGFSRAGLAWVVNGYVIMAGGLLLLGGRLADMFGRRLLFLTGVGVFALASAACGAAVSPAMLVSSRFLQGVGVALATPASLGLIALLFTDPRERIKALGIWGGIAGLAGTLGTVISGVLTDLVSWRWIFYINLPVAAFALVMVPRLVSESRMVREHDKLDLAGPLAGTAGLVAIVYGLLQAATHPWGSVNVLLPLLGGIGLLVVMVVIEAMSSAPSIPLRFFRNRTRVVANFATLFLACAFFAYFFLLTLFEQQVLGYSPLRGGLSYLPMGFAMGAGIGIATKLIARLGVRPVLTAGLALGAVGLLLTSGITVHSTYLGGVLPGMVLFGLASGLCFPCTANASLEGVTGQDSSLASGVQTTMQQVGGAVGLAFLVTLALRQAASHAHDTLPAVAATNGYVLAFRVGAAVLVVAAVMVAALIGHVSARQRAAAPA